MGQCSQQGDVRSWAAEQMGASGQLGTERVVGTSEQVETSRRVGSDKQVGSDRRGRHQWDASAAAVAFGCWQRGG